MFPQFDDPVAPVLSKSGRDDDETGYDQWQLCQRHARKTKVFDDSNSLLMENVDESVSAFMKFYHGAEKRYPNVASFTVNRWKAELCGVDPKSSGIVRQVPYPSPSSQ